MIRIVVVAGDNSERLSNFLRERGTFEIEAEFNSLSDNFDLIQNKIIQSDKLLYLYNVNEATQEADINIKADMQALRNLLISNGFFDPGEIIFVTGTGDIQKQAVQYFTVVMDDCGKTDYTIKTINGRMSFAEVYNAILGVTAEKSFRNTYTKLYRVERNADADVEYEPQDDRDLIIEPFRFDNVKDYTERQKASLKVESGTVFMDSGETNLTTFKDPSFQSIEFTNRLTDQKLILISGRCKSGKSMWTAQLALSSIQCGCTSCVFDFTNNSDIGVMLKRSGSSFRSFRMIDILRYTDVLGGTLSYCSIRNKDEYSVRHEFLQNFISSKYQMFDTVFLTVEHSDFAAMGRLSGKRLTDVIMTCSAEVADVAGEQEYLLEFSENIRSSIILNHNIQMFGDDDYAEVDMLKSANNPSIRLIQEKRFKDFSPKPGLFRSLILK